MAVFAARPVYAYSVGRKVRFVSIALPAFGLVGGVARAMDWPEPLTSLTLIVVFVGSFLASILIAEAAERKRAELEEWKRRDLRLQKLREESVDQQKTLMKLLERQRAEMKELERRQRELARRHRAEYEKLVRKDTA